MKGTFWRWALAAVIAVAAGFWQERSGPTYPVRGTVRLGGKALALKLERSHSCSSDQPVVVDAADPAIAGELVWRRFPTVEPWRTVALERDGGTLRAALPKQPPAGKLEYQVRLRQGDEAVTFPPRPAVTRFKGDVPAVVLVPHILAMFVGMMFAARAGIEALAGGARVRRLAWGTLVLLAVGGFLLGPLVQKYAFGEWWAGVPYGWDLTDNKTLLVGIAWLAAVWSCRGGRPGRAAAVGAAVVTIGVFAIPHSTWGSQIDWSRQPPATAAAPSPAVDAPR